MNTNSVIVKIKQKTYHIRHLHEYTRSLSFMKSRYEFIHKIAPFTWLDDKYFLEYYFFRKMGHRINFLNPQSFNEKLNWMKLFDRNPFYSQISDKYLLRNYVSDNVGSQYLKPIIGVFDDFEEIDWDQLPDKFVIKASHGSGWNILCEDKSRFQKTTVKESIEMWLKQNHYQQSREWQYKNIIPKIIVEHFLETDPYYGSVEYQLYCFDGVTRFIQVDIDCLRNHSRQFLTPGWKIAPFQITRYPRYDNPFPKPAHFDDAKTIAELLTKDLPFCRVDMYIQTNQIYVCEMTLMPAGGFMSFDPPNYDFEIGRWLKLRRYIRE